MAVGYRQAKQGQRIRIIKGKSNRNYRFGDEFEVRDRIGYSHVFVYGVDISIGNDEYEIIGESTDD
jgi:hypothetical protein